MEKIIAKILRYDLVHFKGKQAFIAVNNHKISLKIFYFKNTLMNWENSKTLFLPFLNSYRALVLMIRHFEH